MPAGVKMSIPQSTIEVMATAADPPGGMSFRVADQGSPSTLQQPSFPYKPGYHMFTLKFEDPRLEELYANLVNRCRSRTDTVGFEVAFLVLSFSYLSLVMRATGIVSVAGLLISMLWLTCAAPVYLAWYHPVWYSRWRERVLAVLAVVGQALLLALRLYLPVTRSGRGLNLVYKLLLDQSGVFANLAWTICMRTRFATTIVSRVLQFVVLAASNPAFCRHVAAHEVGPSCFQAAAEWLHSVMTVLSVLLLGWQPPPLRNLADGLCTCTRLLLYSQALLNLAVPGLLGYFMDKHARNQFVRQQQSVPGAEASRVFDETARVAWSAFLVCIVLQSSVLVWGWVMTSSLFC